MSLVDHVLSRFRTQFEIRRLDAQMGLPVWQKGVHVVMPLDCPNGRSPAEERCRTFCAADSPLDSNPAILC